MKFILLTLTCLVAYVAAEPSCPPETDYETVVYFPHPSECKHYNPDHQMYLPHEDCSKYYICSWGAVAIEQRCPPNLHWNQQLSYCDYPAQAGCTSTPSSSTPSSTNTTTPVPAPQATTNCPEVYDPNHQVYFPHADCTRYYICTYEGNKLEQNCPAGLHWSQSSSYCDRPELAQCTPAKDVDDRLECPEVEQEDDFPVFFPHEDCTKYYVCSHQYPYEMDCPEGTYWNGLENVCDAPESSGCVPKEERRVMIRV